MNTNVVREGTALRVDFVGEGGEIVSVRLGDDTTNLDDNAAVHRAKVMMVQLTAFDEPLAATDDDELSNGTNDQREPAPLAVSDVAAPERATH